MIPVNRKPKNENPFAPKAGGTGTFQSQEVTNEAVVVDVIVNDGHPEYAVDGFNVGAVQFRSINKDKYRQQGQLNWALPLESNITDYPLLNEIVLIIKSLNRFYYTRKVNVSHRVTTQALFGLNDELSTPESQSERSKSYQNSTANARQQNDASNQKLGKVFKEQPGIYRLRSDEGDIIFEGRSGHSIRFGAAWTRGQKTNFVSSKRDQAPNLLIRVGPDPNAKLSVQSPFATVVEDINLDDTSVYLVSDQIIPLEYATKGNPVHAKSVVDFPKKLDGNQIVISTGRFVVNAKKDKIMGHSFNGIHWTTNKDFTVDADRDYVSHISRSFKVTAGKSLALLSPKIYLGKDHDESEPVVLGAELAKFLGQLISALTSGPIVLTTGSPGSPSPLSPSILSKLQQLMSDANKGTQASFNSGTAFSVK
jgi:hypothetical protein